MRPVAPRTGAPEVSVAEDQPQYLTITMAQYNYPDGSMGILSRWQPSPAERVAIANGEDVYVMQSQFRGVVTPLLARVGPGDWRVE